MYDLSDDWNCKETGIFAGAFAAGSFLCDDRIDEDMDSIIFDHGSNL